MVLFGPCTVVIRLIADLRDFGALVAAQSALKATPMCPFGLVWPRWSFESRVVGESKSPAVLFGSILKYT